MSSVQPLSIELTAPSRNQGHLTSGPTCQCTCFHKSLNGEARCCQAASAGGALYAEGSVDAPPCVRCRYFAQKGLYETLSGRLHTLAAQPHEQLLQLVVQLTVLLPAQQVVQAAILSVYRLVSAVVRAVSQKVPK